MKIDMKESFDLLDWHDAVLLDVFVDRRNPGDCDEVALHIQWPNGRIQSVRFLDCYAFEALMNFGVRAPESIREGQCIEDSPALRELQQKWAVLGVDLSDIYCFEVKTNSTASLLRMYARRFEMS
ncbi:hypothetical protein [Archangium lipolyticum]|uniref:hypothetical protein n=1 Tax=Archangium lipolyticum TaxID=2970465 RepID=UPI002149E0F1|nr:hypothetical protein [Archangium lipolyticum]